MSTSLHATIEDLYSLPDVKAEIVGGELVIMSPTGAAPSYAAGEIFVNLREHSRKNKIGLAVTDNAAFKVHLPNRESFSPDVAFYIGKWTGMKFFEFRRSDVANAEPAVPGWSIAVDDLFP